MTSSADEVPVEMKNYSKAVSIMSRSPGFPLNAASWLRETNGKGLGLVRRGVEDRGLELGALLGRACEAVWWVLQQVGGEVVGANPVSGD